MFTDRHIDLSMTTALAWVLWAGVAACIVGMFIADDVLHGLTFGTAGCALSAAAATLHIRGFFCAFSARFKAAFELGRETERRAQQERTLHRV